MTRTASKTLVPVLLFALIVAGVTAFLAWQSEEPAKPLRPVRSLDTAQIGRDQVDAALGFRRSAKKGPKAAAFIETLPEAPAPPPPPPTSAKDAARRKAEAHKKAKALNARGLDAYRRGLPDDALTLYSQALAADPTYHWAHYNAACMLAIQRDVEASIEHLTWWHKLAPKTPDVAAKIAKDADFEAIRDDPRLQSWLSSLQSP